MDKGCIDFTEEEMARLRGREADDAECGCGYDLSKYVELSVHTKLEQELADIKAEHEGLKEDKEAVQAVLTAQMRQYENLRQLVGELDGFYPDNPRIADVLTKMRKQAVEK